MLTALVLSATPVKSGFESWSPDRLKYESNVGLQAEGLVMMQRHGQITDNVWSSAFHKIVRRIIRPVLRQVSDPLQQHIEESF